MQKIDLHFFNKTRCIIQLQSKMSGLKEKISPINKSKMNDEGAAVVAAVAVAAQEPAECAICYETYNKSTRAPITCEYGMCGYNACNACVRAYLLTTTTEPHCMDCKQPWTPKFMLSLTKKWVSETYRPHREKLLCEVELSKLAETMEAAERYKLAQQEEPLRANLRLKEREIRKQLNSVQMQIGQSLQREHNLRHNIVVNDAAGAAGAGAAVERRVFFMSCPATNCNGMLSTQYKCGICDHYTCPECHEVIGLNKTTAEHTCNPDNIASAQVIKKDTKQCPGCHNRIYRTEGCSQMWCTGCHTAFDWNTGRKVVNQQLHNPHWVEYQRSQNKGVNPRAPGDVPCGGICTRLEFNQRIMSKIGVVDNQLRENFRSMHCLVSDITYNQIRELRRGCQEMRDFQKERIKYIVGEMTKEQLSAHIFRNDRLRQKKTELLHVFELLSAVGIDLFNRLLTSNLVGEPFIALLLEQYDEYNKLRLHCNSLFAVISNTYNQSVPQIKENWFIETGKYNSKTMVHVAEVAEKSLLTVAKKSSSAAGAGATSAAAAAVPAPKKKVSSS